MTLKLIKMRKSECEIEHIVGSYLQSLKTSIRERRAYGIGVQSSPFKTVRETERERDRETETGTERQGETETDRQTDRQNERQKKKKMEAYQRQKKKKEETNTPKNPLTEEKAMNQSMYFISHTV